VAASTKESLLFDKTTTLSHLLQISQECCPIFDILANVVSRSDHSQRQMLENTLPTGNENVERVVPLPMAAILGLD